MALNINTNITNNLDGYLLDAKNVKGGFVVVEDWSDVENLPSATLTLGSLIYVCTDSLGGGEHIGFYQYNSVGEWIKVPMVGSHIYTLASNEALDYTQTYQFTFTQEQQSQLQTDLLRVLSDRDGTTLPMFMFNFNGVPFIIQLHNVVTLQTTIQSSTLVVSDNNQYIAVISIPQDLSALTLSFQELQAGSGGGGEAVGTLWYQHLFTLHDAYNSDDVIISVMMPEDRTQYLISGFNQMMSTNFTTLAEVMTAINQTLAGGIATIDQVAIFVDALTNFSFDSKPLNSFAKFMLKSVDPTYWFDFADLDTTGMLKAVPTNALNNYVSPTQFQLDLPSSMDLVITPLGNASGGSSTGGGSGKLYELSMELTRYDDSGNSVDWSFNYAGSGQAGETITGPLKLVFNIYESNFEKIKSKLAPLGININTIQDFVSYINNNFNETISSANTTLPLQLTSLIGLVDKCYIPLSLSNYGLNFDFPVEVFGNDYRGIFVIRISIRWNDEQIYSTLLTFNDSNLDDVYYGLSVNNSCTLTEYGTSGGGGASATKKWYELELNTSTGDNRVNKLFIKMPEDAWNELKTDNAQALSQYGITNPEDFVTLFDQLKISGDYTPFTGYISKLYVMLGMICSYTMKYNSIPFISMPDVSGITGIVTSIDNDSGFIEADKGISFTLDSVNRVGNFYIDSDSTLTITEETETVSGGSSSSQPTDTNAIDYIEVKDTIIGNAQIVFIFQKGALNTTAIQTSTNQLIDFFNQQYSLSIPSYSKIEDFYDINEYLKTLESTYDQVIIVFYSALFSMIQFWSLSVKGYVNGEVVPISVEALFDQANSVYVYNIKYLSANSNPFGYQTAISSSNFATLNIHINDFD